MKIQDVCKSIICCIFKIMAAGILSMLLLTAYVFVFNYSGVHINNETKATDYKWQSNQWKAVSGEGFAWNRFDKDGFNNSKLPSTVDNLLMGSSHMEAVNISQNENVAAVLNALSDKSTYNIGISGHVIYTCVQNMKDAVNYYNPRDYVILETDTINLDELQMKQVLDGEYPRIKSYDSGLLFTIQKKMPVIKTLYKAVDDWRSAEPGSGVSEKVQEKAYDSEYEELLNRFIAKASDSAASSGAKLIIVYHPITEITSTGKLRNGTKQEALTDFTEACDNNGVIFLDMTYDFKKMYEDKHILCHGFVNTAVGSGHLNKYGHRVIAERLAKTIGGKTDVIE